MEESYYQLIAMGVIVVLGKAYSIYIDHKVKRFEDEFIDRAYSEHIPKLERLESRIKGAELRVKETFQSLFNKIEGG